MGQAFLYVEVIGPYVAEGHYNLAALNGETILPRVWETMIEPGWVGTMHIWPWPEPPPRPPAPPEEAANVGFVVPPREKAVQNPIRWDHAGRGQVNPVPKPTVRHDHLISHQDFLTSRTAKVSEDLSLFMSLTGRG